MSGCLVLVAFIVLMYALVGSGADVPVIVFVGLAGIGLIMFADGLDGMRP